jgi:LemA protein
LVAASQNVDAKWAQVQSQYQRRADLIPNLVQTVSGVANFEKSTLTEITEARASIGKVQITTSQAPAAAQELEKFEKAQGQLSSALSRLLVVAERYPDLKASTNFRDLQAQLEGTENRITVARQDFNEAVQLYNTMVKRFPTVLLVTKWLQPKPYSAVPGAKRTPPKVQRLTARSAIIPKNSGSAVTSKRTLWSAGRGTAGLPEIAPICFFCAGHNLIGFGRNRPTNSASNQRAILMTSARVVPARLRGRLNRKLEASKERFQPGGRGRLPEDGIGFLN